MVDENEKRVAILEIFFLYCEQAGRGSALPRGYRSFFVRAGKQYFKDTLDIK